MYGDPTNEQLIIIDENSNLWIWVWFILDIQILTSEVCPIFINLDMFIKMLLLGKSLCMDKI